MVCPHIKDSHTIDVGPTEVQLLPSFSLLVLTLIFSFSSDASHILKLKLCFLLSPNILNPRDWKIMNKNLSFLTAYRHTCVCVCVLVAQSCPNLCDSHGLQPARLLCPWNSPGKNTGVGCHSLLQGIFPTRGMHPGLLHGRRILYHLSHPTHRMIILNHLKKCVSTTCPSHLCDPSFKDSNFTNEIKRFVRPLWPISGS